MALSATFVADFSSFMDATRDAVAAMQGFKLTAEELGPGVDRNLQETQRQLEQVGRQTRQLGTDVMAASQTFIQAYAEEQDAVVRLNSALAATGQATPAVVQAYADLATQFQNTTQYADEAIINVQAVLTSIGTVGPEQMELALTAVTNLASGMKIDLNQAALLVAKAFASGGDELGRLKQILGDAYQPGMDAAQMLEAINSKFGSAATDELQTYHGQMAQLTNVMSDFQETVGKVLVETLGKVLSAFQALPEPVQSLTIAVVAIGTAVAPVLVSLAALVSILATAGIGSAMVTGLTAVIAVLTGPVGIAIAAAAVLAAIVYNWDAIVDYTQKLYAGVKLWLLDKFTAIAQAITQPIGMIVGAFRSMYQALVGGSIVPDTIAGIAQQFGRLNTEMVQPVRAATAEVIDEYGRMQRYIAQRDAILSRNTLYTSLSQKEDIASLAERIFAPSGGGGGGGASAAPVINITMNGMLGANDPQTRQMITQVVGEALAQAMRGQRLLSSA